MNRDQGSISTPDIDRFIEQANLTDYQRITLPNGRILPGKDRLPTANLIYPADLTGKTVLDVGCHYGFFLHDAVRRGAAKAVGIEMDPERFQVAKTLAPLWAGKIDIHEGLLENTDLDEQFDMVLFLNVLHHVGDPVAVMHKLASLCRGTVVVEFRQPHDPQFVQEGLHGSPELTGGKLPYARRLARRVRRSIEAPVMELISRRLPVIGVGAVEYDRSYFFSQAAFRNTFVTHNRIFKSVEFRPSIRRGQALAFCECGAEDRQA